MEKILKGERRKSGLGMEQSEVTRKKVKEAIERLKRGKAAGKYGMEELGLGSNVVTGEMWKIFIFVIFSGVRKGDQNK